MMMKKAMMMWGLTMMWVRKRLQECKNAVTSQFLAHFLVRVCGVRVVRVVRMVRDRVRES